MNRNDQKRWERRDEKDEMIKKRWWSRNDKVEIIKQNWKKGWFSKNEKKELIRQRGLSSDESVRTENVWNNQDDIENWPLKV